MMYHNGHEAHEENASAPTDCQHDQQPVDAIGARLANRYRQIHGIRTALLDDWWHAAHLFIGDIDHRDDWGMWDAG